MATDYQLIDAYKYRALRLTEPKQRGWDIFALQTALNEAGGSLDTDGVFGKLTKAETERFQRKAKLVPVDGIAGVITQRELALWIADPARAFYDLPYGLLTGQLEHESSFWLGNYTAAYGDGKRDIGVAQRNENYTPRVEGFNVPLSIKALAERIATKHTQYLNLNVADPRAWELAAGSWNAPSWTDTLAKGGTLTSYARAHIESYISAVTTYCEW